MKTAVYRRARFNAAHRLYNKDWDEEKNDRIFAKCNSPNYHGHNYTLFVKVTGEVDPETGYVIDLGRLKQLIEQEVVARFDHKNLNKDVPDFKALIPTAENITRVIWERMRRQLDERYELQVRLYETERNFVEYPG